MDLLSCNKSTEVRVIDTIRKSDIDQWNYRGLELANGLLCVLASHETLDKSAAALNVSIGTMADPKDIPGVAHFVEHMLFMGSEKYPTENEFSKFIESNGGYYNAYTTAAQTNYHFDVNPKVFAEALDIFANFFVSPLFHASSTDREIRAIDSEFRGNLFTDSRRIFQIEKLMVDPEHPYSKFSTGNIESLQTIPQQRGIDIREVLLDFYTNQYSANRMSLVVLSNHSLDELQSLVVKNFKDIVNKQLPMVRYPADPFGEIGCKTVCYIVPIAEDHKMKIRWVIPDFRELYYCSPGPYLSFLIRHRGTGSLFSHLKKLGFASSIQSLGGTHAAPGFNFFTMELNLTREGLERWREVVVLVYQYLAMMRKEGPQKRIFEEQKTMRLLNFQFAAKDSANTFVTDLASTIRDYPLTNCLFGPYALHDFRPDLITQLLEQYIMPTKMQIYLIGKEFSTIATEKERWYGIQYKQEYLSEEFIQKCETCESIDAFHLPSSNDFIPTDFQLHHNQYECAIEPVNKITRPQLPTKIKEDEYCRLFHADDGYYKLPRACMYFDLSNSSVNSDPAHENMNSLYVELVIESLSELTYPAKVTGLFYALSASDHGIEMCIGGYNDKICVLLETIVDCMINLKVDDQRLKILRERRKENLRNFRAAQPHKMAKEEIDYLTAQHQWSNNELLNNIDDIMAHDIEMFMQRLFTSFYVDSLMYGNLTKDQAIRYMTIFQEKFREKRLFRPLSPSLWLKPRHLILPQGSNFAYKTDNDGYQMNAVVFYLQCFQQSLENNALINLFAHIAHEPCYNQLRTKEQLGYIVSSGVYRIRGVRGFQITVQSNKGFEYLNQRIELFLDSMREYIERMSDEEFLKQREGYIVSSLEIPKSMESQADTYWSEILCHQFCFDKIQLQSEFVKRLERKDMLEFYDRYISLRSPYRQKLMVFVQPSPLALASTKSDTSPQSSISEVINHPTEQITNVNVSDSTIVETEASITVTSDKEKELQLPQIQWIENVHVWKSQMACYPLAQPYGDINISTLNR
ncbi:unnamed protein product [Adineta ricciae]|uniref:Insulin-degrading enzyme-like protein n=1 Tax=Adineta ricciae TaxID=249248 RepID=A0A813YLQ2_ADIRI|nr:unnamed protein product [Adineta ricciae]CAF0977386.1 unnamed protein product [Adineta ricciae]